MNGRKQLEIVPNRTEPLNKTGVDIRLYDNLIQKEVVCGGAPFFLIIFQSTAVEKQQQ